LAADVVQHRFDDVRLDADICHACGGPRLAQEAESAGVSLRSYNATLSGETKGRLVAAGFTTTSDRNVGRRAVLRRIPDNI